MTMTSRERVDAAFNHREPDRTPLFEYVLLSPVADALLGRRCAYDPENWFDLEGEIGWEAAVRRSAEDHATLAALLGWDMIYVLPNPVPNAPRPSYHQEPGPTSDPVENLRRRNAAARVQDPTPPESRFLILEHLREELTKRDLDLPLFCPAYEHGVWTDIDLMQAMLLAPELAEEHFQLATRRAMAWVEKYLAWNIEILGVGGDFSANRPMISPASYRRFIVPEVRKVSQHLHVHGRRTLNASDGNLWPFLDDFLFGCEVDGYVEIDLFASMDLRRLKEKVGDRVTLVGNLDCGNTLSRGTPDDVRRHVIDTLEAGRGGGGHILTASNAITASVPLGNYLAGIEAYRAFFGLPPLARPA